ncbi:hypothetical protein D9758_001139 [Tetrapyrgos nigripes]|uniref:F-box domain-containing protein n=1 Tax=Tetrapyrgos nigripes TaxID=182062 RepID=A0A8H5GRW7_9AGAR|nr:hypothetical protein D9758_001139 [Tetrapyrgos nigripes]
MPNFSFKSEVLEQLRNIDLSDADDIDFVKQRIGHHIGVISTIQDEVETLQQQIRRLRFRQFEHQEAVNFYHGKITLARRLPSELLAAIFEMCVQDGWTRTPLTVSHVCSEWRAAASIPSVWSHVFVNFDARDPYGRASFWLSKSQTVPLHISLEIVGDITHLPRVADLLLSHSSRWKSLSVVSSLQAYAHFFLSRCSTSFPQLRQLSISIAEVFDSQVPEEDQPLISLLRTAFADAPELRALSITQNILPLEGALPPSLTHLSFSFPSVDAMDGVMMMRMNRMLNVLENASQVKHLSITLPVGRTFMHDHDLDRIVSLPSLESLVLAGTSGTHTMLSWLHTPALSRLHLVSSTESQGVSLITGMAITRLLQRSDPPLQLLQLRDVDIPQQSFIDVFALLPKLKTLRLHDSDISNDVFEFFLGQRLDFGSLGSVKVLVTS